MPFPSFPLSRRISTRQRGILIPVGGHNTQTLAATSCLIPVRATPWPISSLIPAVSCRRCSPNAPFARLETQTKLRPASAALGGKADGSSLALIDQRCLAANQIDPGGYPP